MIFKYNLNIPLKEYREGCININRIYRKANYNVYDMGEGYIIHNIKKPFVDGHTHINNYKTCLYLINLSIHNSIPHHLNEYFLISLKRLATDEDYIEKIDKLLETKSNKERQTFRNRPKQFARKRNHRNNYQRG